MYRNVLGDGKQVIYCRWTYPIAWDPCPESVLAAAMSRHATGTLHARLTIRIFYFAVSISTQSPLSSTI